MKLKTVTKIGFIAMLLALPVRSIAVEIPARLHWIGRTPEAAKPVSFGIPFAKGEFKPTDAFALTTDKGEVVTADFWPTAYWPDGSVKWGGFAAVVPGGVKEISLVGRVKKEKGKSEACAMRVEESTTQICIHTGALRAYISKSGTAIVDSLVMGGTRVAGQGKLVCTIQDQPYTEGVGSIRFENLESRIDKAEVERSGHVRAVVKIEGRYNTIGSAALPPTGGAGRGAFVVRLYFYAGSEQVRMVHTFTYEGDQNRDFIRALGVRFEVPMREQAYNRHVAFATQDGGVWSESVQPLSGRRILEGPTPDPSREGRGEAGAETAKGQESLPSRGDLEGSQVAGKRIPEPSAFDAKGQDLLHHWAKWNTYRLSQPNDQGYTVTKRAHANNQWIGTHTGHRAAGYAFAGDVSGGLGICIKDFWESYPASLQVDSATHDIAYLTAYLWSPDAGPMDLRHYDNVAHDLNASYEDVQEGMSTPYGIARTSVITLLPERAYPGKAAVAQRAQQLSEDAPLVCTPEYLHSRRAFGIWSLPGACPTARMRSGLRWKTC